MNMSRTIQQLFGEPKGILAADESAKTATKRLQTIKVASTAELRRRYRQMLFETPDFAQYVSGVILHEETFWQNNDNGTRFVDYLDSQHVLSGIKVDCGLVPLTNFEPETITEGLDGLADRLHKYATAGASFTKWRAAFQIDQAKSLPTLTTIHANLNIMARYAALAQSNDLVPLVEPEVLYDGAHTIEQAAEATSNVLRILFDILDAYRVDLSHVILKTSMVLAGKDSENQSTPDQVAKYTLAVLRDRVPAELGGIVFLSGGQTPEQASNNLNAIDGQGTQPWPITFSFSRAVQDPAMKLWAGQPKNIPAAQKEFAHWLHINSLARRGKLATEK
jgi:fructose-bisphosphate aldolase class I